MFLLYCKTLFIELNFTFTSCIHKIQGKLPIRVGLGENDLEGSMNVIVHQKT